MLLLRFVAVGSLVVLAASAKLALPAADVVVLDLVELEDGLPVGWKLKATEGKVLVLERGRQAPAEASWVRVEEEDGVAILRLGCRDASFSLNRDLSEPDLDDSPVLEWTWRASKLPAGGDFRDSERNDQALQILVQMDTFRKRVISYVWDTTAPKEATETESYGFVGLYTVKVLCVESGEKNLGRWLTERRNVAEDYKRLFGADDFPGVKGIRIQSNSQHTHGEGAGSIRSLVFRGKEALGDG